MSSSAPLQLNARALHWVFKIGDRERSIQFFRDVLGMKVLRHEEFSEGCKATCNGPYNGKWSKTMIGFGPEDNHFVAELTYNYGIDKYKLGNDLQGLFIHKKNVLEKAKELGFEVQDSKIIAPDGYPFYLDECDSVGDPVQKVRIGVSSLKKSLSFWKGILGMHTLEETDKRAVLRFSEGQATLELQEVDGGVIDHATAFGRIAFAVPVDQLKGLEARIKETNNTILTPYTELDTPGKATVVVVILGDPDGHEICFVGDEAFKELSQVDPNADQLLKDAMEADKSKEWFAKKGLSKEEA